MYDVNDLMGTVILFKNINNLHNYVHLLITDFFNKTAKCF